MSRFAIAVVPIGRIDSAEVEASATRAGKLLRRALELREALPVPQGTEDAERGQHRAASFMAQLRGEVPKLRRGRILGELPEGESWPARPDAFVFLTDVDLFTATTDGVFAALMGAKKTAVVSIRRLREAFYRRRADPTRQRARFVKEIARMGARIQGLPECNDPNCLLAASKSVPDLDLKEERFCRSCESRLFEGRVQI